MDKIDSEEQLIQDAIIFHKKKELFEDLKAFEDSLDPVDLDRHGYLRKVILIGVLILSLILALYFIFRPPINFVDPTKEERIFAQYFEPYPAIGLVRSGGSSKDGTLEQAIQAYNRADYAQSSKEFSVYYQETKDTISLFYLGIAQLSQNQTDAALTTFKQFQSISPILQEQTNWYIALAYLRKQDLVSLKNLMRNMPNSKYKTEIKQIIEQLESS